MAQQTNSDDDPSLDCRGALDLLRAFLAQEGIDADRYKLVAATNRIPLSGPSCWLLVLKLRELIPASPAEEVGAGGEIRIEVDVASGKSRIVGYGE